jgi:hypothetical protein
VDESNSLETGNVPYKIGAFKTTETFFGHTLGGRNPPVGQLLPGHFSHLYEALISTGRIVNRSAIGRDLYNVCSYTRGELIMNVSIYNYISPLADLVQKEAITARAKKERRAKVQAYAGNAKRKGFEESLWDGAVHAEDLLLNSKILSWIESERSAMFEDESKRDEVNQDIKDLMESFQREPNGRLSVILPKNEQCRLPLSRNV